MKVNLKLKWSLKKQPEFPISLPVGECVKSSDDHERYLSCEENSNDYDQHQGGALGIPLLPAFSDHAATGNVVSTDQSIIC